MNILKNERTYQFSYEGLALARTDNRISNTIDKYNSIGFTMALGVTLTGLYLLSTPLANIVSFKAENGLIVDTAFKMITKVI